MRNALIKNVHSVGIAVLDLDKEVEFYQRLGFKTGALQKVENDPRYAELFGLPAASFQTVILDTQLALLELMEFQNPPAIEALDLKPVYGPGITHVCFKSPATNPAYDRNKAAGSQLISRGDQPVDLAGAGITYAYARDPEGNIHEVEQLDNPDQAFDFWMGHVSLVTPDIERLATFYQQLIDDDPVTPPVIHVKDRPQFDKVADIDGLEVKGAWVRGLNLEIEIWQYLEPATPVNREKRLIQRQGYNQICFEVADIEAEYQRLLGLGVEFISTPIDFEDFIAVVGHDPDGNLFQLKQFIKRNYAILEPV